MPTYTIIGSGELKLTLGNPKLDLVNVNLYAKLAAYGSSVIANISNWPWTSRGNNTDTNKGHNCHSCF